MRAMASPSRRTQAERTATMRARLMDATIESLVELGYEATTSRVVAERAGVSRGAQTHHFPRRLDLIVGAVGEIAQRRTTHWVSELERLPRGGARVRRVLDLMWEEFTGPLAIAATKLWIAAHDDPELSAQMAPMEREVVRTLRRQLRELLDGPARSKEFDHRLNVAFSTVRGLALQVTFGPVEREGGDPWLYHRRVLERMLTE